MLLINRGQSRFIRELSINPNLGGCGRDFYPNPPDSELVKTVNLAFFSFQQLFDRDIHVKFGLPKSLHTTDIRQKPDLGISSFQKFGQIPYKQKSS